MSRPAGTGKYIDGKVDEPEYESSHPEKLLQCLKQGMLDCEIYAAFNISKATFYRWRNEHPEFNRAYEIGFPHCESHWLVYGKKGMQGEIKGFNFNSWISFMNNKFTWKKDTSEGSGTTNINIQNMAVLQSKPKEGLIEYIKTVGAKNQDILNIEFTDDSADKPEQS